MKLELYKPYKTRAGHKAVAVDGPDEGGFFTVANVNDWSLYKLWPDGHSMKNGISQFDIVSEWQEPRKGEFWVNVFESEGFIPWTSCHPTKKDADLHRSLILKGGCSKFMACKYNAWTEGDQE